jgi:signal transduction histidine kinase
VYHAPPQLGRRPFAAYVTILGVGCVATSVVGVLGPVLALDTASWADWTRYPLLVWLLSTLPWFVFALRYTGTRTEIPRRTLLLAGLPYALFVVQVGATAVLGVEVDSAVLNGVGSALFIYVLSLAIGGTYLLLQKTYRFGHVPTGQGVSLVVAPVGSLVVWNVIGMMGETTPATQAAVFAAGGALVVVSLGAAVVRYDLFESTPAIGTLGERALTRETDDLMFVVDADGRLTKINQTAVEQLQTLREATVGRALDDVLNDDVDGLRRAETVTLQTADGTRQYDPQVAAVRDHRDDRLGAMVSLRDVTGRRLREQRLAVLNRILRHNLRNQADVVKSHAEALDETETDHAASIRDAADAIVDLGARARSIDQFVSGSTEETAIDLTALVGSVLETVGAADADVAVSVDCPSSATVSTDRRAVTTALESALDNAVTYAETSVTVAVEERRAGVAVTVADDGPGIPESELDSLEAGTESPLEHSTGLGLWQLKWAVFTLDGDLSFDVEDGTTVEFVVPDGDSARASE